MTGFEYCAAVGMLYEGMEEDALTCIPYPMNSRCSRNSCLDGLLSSCFYQHPNIGTRSKLSDAVMMVQNVILSVNRNADTITLAPWQAGLLS